MFSCRGGMFILKLNSFWLFSINRQIDILDSVGDLELGSSGLLI